MYRNTASRCWLRAFRLIFQLPLRNTDTHLRWLNDGRVAIELSVSHVLYLCQSNEILSGARLSNKVTQAVLTSLLSERESLSVLLMFATLWTPCSAIRGYLQRLVVHCQPKYSGISQRKRTRDEFNFHVFMVLLSTVNDNLYRWIPSASPNPSPRRRRQHRFFWGMGILSQAIV